MKNVSRKSQKDYGLKYIQWMSPNIGIFFIRLILTSSLYLTIKITSGLTKVSPFYPFQIMRTYLLIFSFLILTWQAIVITNTLATRLEERTQEVHQLLKEI